MLKKLLSNFLGFILPFVCVLKFIRDCMLVFLDNSCTGYFQCK